MYIACAAKVAKGLRVDFIMAPHEADGQLAAPSNDLVVSSDGDMLALGVTRFVKVDNWFTGRGTLIDVDLWKDRDDQFFETFPLAQAVLKFGPRVFVLWGAACGCDFSESASGLPGVGDKAMLTLLRDCPSLDTASVVR